MNEIQQIIAVASSCLGLIATVTGFLIPLVKNVKAKNKLTALNKLTAVLQTLIVDAEKLTDFTGEEKKQYVLTKANRYAIDNNIAFDEAAAGEKIEELISLSKNVNAKIGTNATVPAEPAACTATRQPEDLWK